MIREKRFGNVKDFDNKLKKKVRMLETDIPQELEERVLNEINRLSTFSGISTSPAFPRSRGKTRVYLGVLAAAASLFLAVLLAITVLFRPSSGPVVVEREVSIDFAEVEGQPANTYIVSEQNPEITIIWFEKAPMVSMDTNLNKKGNSNKI
jgi:hypothetical protein